MRTPDPNAPECDCGGLEKISKEPEGPIVFDPEINEYNLAYRTQSGIQMQYRIYHCLFCGGRTPASRRDEMFMHVTDAERIRLMSIVCELKTLPDLIAALGAPDEDDPAGTAMTKTADDGREQTNFYRLLTYNNLSPTAHLCVQVGLDNRVECWIWPKGRDADPLRCEGASEASGWEAGGQ
jgi:hypothetical protein